MGAVVKLNRFRKKKQRATKAKQAEINRIRHGRTQAEKDLELAERERAARLLEGKRLEHGGDEQTAAAEPTSADQGKQSYDIVPPPSDG